jgi:hypothetical protein
MVLHEGFSIFYFWFFFDKPFCENGSGCGVNMRALFCIAENAKEAENMLTNYYLSNFDVQIEDVQPKNNSAQYSNLNAFAKPQEIMGFDKYVSV